jgi:putative lipoprotein
LKKLAVVLFFTLSITNAQDIPKDKQLHFAAGMLSSSVDYDYVYSKTKDRKKAFAAGILTSVLAGVAKETYDSTQPGNKFDIKDFGATALGGISVSVTIQLFNKKKKKKNKQHEK